MLESDLRWKFHFQGIIDKQVCTYQICRMFNYDVGRRRLVTFYSYASSLREWTDGRFISSVCTEDSKRVT